MGNVDLIKAKKIAEEIKGAPNKKQVCGEAAAEYVSDGMIVGLGTGSTVFYTIKKLGERRRARLDISGIPTSIQTEILAGQEGIPLIELRECDKIDVTIDGADEVDPHLNLIKGLGGALLREKIVAQNSKKMIVVVDDSKLVTILGERTPVPVEVVKFAWQSTAARLKRLGCEPKPRMSTADAMFITDNGNYILDCKFQKIEDPYTLAQQIKATPGVVEHGLFVNLASVILVGNEKGVRVIEREQGH
ncbi:MAG: ribose 5-phosphate isomerase A [Thermoplasmata archaeon HGW-Thermoplasmata-2]|nr:MAG: ribose 5-phosphate isomerase A [Thermoplasmata archaeon HGW-Thermoplasmata-2]